ncbi:MAG: hypothetical protein QOI80_2035, partial [Solirubrobacteraceae bacterium]|nr:hypothetical protein [Solirubrobacteraceae bacterium]
MRLGGALGGVAVAFAAACAGLGGLAPASACAQGLPQLPTLGPIDPACSRVPDSDVDGVIDYQDNCHRLFNPSQDDTDKDSGPPPYEPVPVTYRDPVTGGDACDVDDDGDAVPDIDDDCPKLANADQADADGDGLGDVCDPSPTAAGGPQPSAGPKLTIHGLARRYRSAELRAGLAVPVRCTSACALSGVLRARKTVLGRGVGGLQG